ncbi:VacJ family lipoprotein [Dokdonella sp.]|uniref:MlaA family lipoprotein n=1 Tax=Dokdonella sp. TaxID=2291710 RepID=UPI001B1C8022|nr:VacJ family lipoprotein [Dokdonella sp.]MBO9664298.1 VacJ family lipoprotein [Dokdonella sp.]
MRSTTDFARLRAGLLAASVAFLAGCTIAKPRTDDPWEGFNRKMYAFNDAADKAVIRPVAVGYRKITTPNMRRVVSNFFANIKMPITIVNDVLQAEPTSALRNTGRFAINTTLGFLGLFDPASEMSLPPDNTDFGVTLAKWGLPEGPYLVLPLIGSTTVRDVWRMPVDNYFDPLGWYAREHDDYAFLQRYGPNLAYLVTLRARAIDAESLLEGVYDPYVFYRDAYRQRRLYDIYDRNPPTELIEQMQGTDDVDIDELLKQQHEYEQQKKNGGDTK